LKVCASRKEKKPLCNKNGAVIYADFAEVTTLDTPTPHFIPKIARAESFSQQMSA
jgi:hypothetical protein